MRKPDADCEMIDVDSITQYKMEIHGDNFTLREWQLTDAASLQRNADNPNVCRYLLDRFPNPYTMEAAESWVKLWQGQDPVVNFAIVHNDELIGGIGLDLRADVYCKSPLIGYWLAQAYWGKGVMHQVVKLIVNHAFTNLGAICISAFVMGPNAASMQVLEKAGFSKVGIIPQSVIKNGEVLDEHLYVINR
jgi:ribosomal-protein-alanine N-acetyltransferase